MNDKLKRLADLGQSIWLDYIRRSFTLGGGLADLVNQGVRGVTSNPSIFEKAIAGSDDYDAQLAALAVEMTSPQAVYEALALEDIRNAADTLRVVYQATDGMDGFVSLEVSPDLAYETEQTIAEARRLFAAADRPNVLIKVPATPQGIPAIKTLIGEGININVTLIFSLDQYDAVAEAYISGLEALAARGGDLSQVASVASLFISRLDVKVDERLRALGTPDAEALLGKIGLANAKVTYQHFKDIFSGERWEKLVAQGARYQRPLWASTSTKDPAYPDTLYIDNLIGPHTVNTTPPETLDAFLDHGQVAETVDVGLDEARARLDRLSTIGVDLDTVMAELLEEGVTKFVKPFASLMDSIEVKVRTMRLERFGARLGDDEPKVAAARARMQADNILKRIRSHDFLVWDTDPTEIANRLGWLEAPAAFRTHVDRVTDFVDAVRADGYTHVLLLGMGGSSLAPDVFSRVFGPAEDYLALDILDSTHPGAVLAYERKLDPSKTLFVVASKSGGTAETLSFYKYFYNRVVEAVGEAAAGAHFAAITDPGSKLLGEAEARGFRKVFINDPTLGGRYSAFSYFGLVPAGLLGVDLATLLDRALDVADGAVAFELGAIMGVLAKAGRDKLTLVTPPGLVNFGDWVEQLVAESTGKRGVGILPVVDEPLATSAEIADGKVYGDDRLFVVLQLGDDGVDPAQVAALVQAGHPVVELKLRDVYDVGEQIYTWELATAIAGHLLGIQPFNQPNVEAAKKLARKMIETYQTEGTLPEVETSPLTTEALDAFLAEADAGDYLALQAYVQPTPETTEALQALRLAMRDRTKLATTVGYGPRYLHSTGQLHKGDGGNGLFIQFTSDATQDAGIPDEAGSSASSISFGVLVRAQALGDYQALVDAGRRVIHFRLGDDVAPTLRAFAAEVAA